MQERRDPPAEAGSHPPIAPAAELSPKQAHDRYTAHANPKVCQRCSDVDRGRCPEGEQLWKAWSDACDTAYQQLHRGAP